MAGLLLAGVGGIVVVGHHRGPPVGPALLPATVPVPAPALSPPAPVAAPPFAVRVPAIGIDATVVDEGLNPDGTVQVPPLTVAGIRVAGWYDRGPYPGQVGSAVLLGHVDAAAYGPGVFYRIGTLRPGDQIIVTRVGAPPATFAVTALRRYPKSSFPDQEVYGSTGRPALRLVSCGGDFDPGTGHYLDNIVVYADLSDS